MPIVKSFEKNAEFEIHYTSQFLPKIFWADFPYDEYQEQGDMFTVYEEKAPAEPKESNPKTKIDEIK